VIRTRAATHQAYAVAATIVSLLGDQQRATVLARQAHATAPNPDNPVLYWAWDALQLAHYYTNRTQEADAARAEMVRLSRLPGQNFNLVYTSGIQTFREAAQGNVAAALPWAKEAMSLAHGLRHNLALAWATLVRGRAAQAAKDFDHATEYYRSCPRPVDL
jgi:tetratricopeptide (TPR) repeat protein